MFTSSTIQSSRTRSSRSGGRRRSGADIKTGNFTTYQQATNYLLRATDYERMTSPRYNVSTFSLARMRRLVSKLGSPHRQIKTVHLAGTKGKGSTAAMLAAMLQNCGLKVGVYSSPHLTELRERITINGTMVSEAEMTRLLNKVAAASKIFKTTPPTFFEVMTAVAFLHFANREVDIALMETGLGGRLDATNVIRPLVAGITSISKDHTRQLGNTLAKIAEEKAGIMKSNVPVISSPQEPEVVRVLKRCATSAKAPLRITGEQIEFSCRFENTAPLGPHNRVCVNTEFDKYEHLPVPLMGDHQAINCVLAFALLDVLRQSGFNIDMTKAIAGLEQTKLPGRMEMVHNDPRIMVDGAHNAASIAALMRGIGQSVPYDSMVVIFGTGMDKDIEGMLQQLTYGADKIIFTRSTKNPRASDPATLAASYEESSGKMAQTAPNLEEALRIAGSAVTREDLICVTGSFYLVGEAKKLMAK